ncbi:hypothetical protein BBJ29_004009 [Phytophthora kernoviae]|uniref:Uncharacterized protein n=1 Tax=Phytophthora kernoviae TaxID=325452 RepID=A0A3F2RL87_9STRA|nr:hypothetical protein BBP00_00006395 [Phytophthora kernoviae]RLN71470.1 hypothetical protein BBJ29_004009 [Phytophthora kernoviae]
MAKSPKKLLLAQFATIQRVYRGEEPLNHVAVVLKASLFTNIVIVIVMTSVAVASNSLALISALVENMVDLFVQGLLWYAGTRSGKKQDYTKYPAGTSRFEPVAIIVAASVMVLASIVFIQESVKKLLDGFASDEPEAPILWILKTTVSAAVEAIHQDNFNDMISNSFAVTAYIVSSVEPEAWYVDPAGAILIFLYIMVAWGKMAWEQVTQLVGVCASDEFIEEVKNLCNNHHASMTLDIVRAYHFGSKYLVELEVVVPADMSVKLAHDLALQVQFKVENFEEVERAFVHVDYQSRGYDEHVVSQEADALVVYAGYDSSCANNMGGMEQFPVAVEVSETAAPGTPTATSFSVLKD